MSYVDFAKVRCNAVGVPSQTESDPDGWARVAAAVDARILELNLTIAKLVRKSGVTAPTWKRVRAGLPLTRRDKFGGVCKGLGWTSDSIDRLLRGDPAELLHNPGRDPMSNEELTRSIVSLQARLDHLEGETAEARELRDETARQIVEISGQLERLHALLAAAEQRP